MRIKNGNTFLSVILLIVTSLACSSLSTPPTTTPAPTNTSVPTKTPPPTSTPITVDLGAEQLETAPYTHPSQAVSFNPPIGWTIEDSSYDVFIHSPESVFFYVSVTNTGRELDKDSFANYVDNVENNYYTFEDKYTVTNREANDAINLILVEKTYLYQGTPTFARSIYQQLGQSVYMIEMIGNSDEIAINPNYDLTFSAFFKTVNADSDIAATLPVYDPKWNFFSITKTYGINVPIGWAYNVYDVSGTFEAQNELVSPDGNVLIEVITLDEGTQLDLNYMNTLALQILNSGYGKNDVVILDKGEQDGNQLLEWTSAGSNFNGYAYIGTSKATTEAFLFIILWDKGFEDSYRQMAIDILSTFNKK